MPYISQSYTKKQRHQKCYILLASLMTLISFSTLAVTPSDQNFNAETPRYLSFLPLSMQGIVVLKVSQQNTSS